MYEIKFMENLKSIEPELEGRSFLGVTVRKVRLPLPLKLFGKLALDYPTCCTVPCPLMNSILPSPLAN